MALDRKTCRWCGDYTVFYNEVGHNVYCTTCWELVKSENGTALALRRMRTDMPDKVRMETQLSSWTTQIIAIARDIHKSQMEGNYSKENGTRHFANLLRHNIEQIDKLSDMLSEL